MPPKRVVLYARYSTDMQNERSLEDQLASCRKLLKDDEVVVAEYSDSGISGSNIHNRPGVKDLLVTVEDNPAVDVIITESIDRLSRSQAQIAQIFAMAEYHQVAIRTVLEGDVEDIHIGIKGTMNAIELKKTSERTRRGLRGSFDSGSYPGGLAYGYRMGAGKGQRDINEGEAPIVREIFTRYLAGDSVKSIVADLNRRQVRTSRGNRWTVVTVRGHQGRGTGILQNPVYKGVVVWNRCQWVKHPVTGRRTRRDNDPSLWMRQDRPELRIVDTDIWDKVQAKLAEAYTPHKKEKFYRAPPFAMTCGECQGPIVRQNEKYLVCRNYHVHGDCNQSQKTNLEELYNDLLTALQRDPEQRYHHWKKNLITINPNNHAVKLDLEREIRDIGARIIELQELQTIKEHELAALEPVISTTPTHQRRFIEICKAAVEPAQIVSFIAGVTIARRGGGRPVVDNLKPNWSSIIKLAPSSRPGHKTPA